MGASASACGHGVYLWDDYDACYDAARFQLYDWHGDMFVVRWTVHVAASEAYRFVSTLDSVAMRRLCVCPGASVSSGAERSTDSPDGLGFVHDGFSAWPDGVRIGLCRSSVPHATKQGSLRYWYVFEFISHSDCDVIAQADGSYQGI